MQFFTTMNLYLLQLFFSFNDFILFVDEIIDRPLPLSKANHLEAHYKGPLGRGVGPM